jgi:hypothetical protein
MIGIWEEIDLLVFEARMQLSADGYVHNPGTDGVFDPEDPDEKISSLVGAKVFAHDDEGRRGEETVWYPDDWFKRAYPKEAE